MKRSFTGLWSYISMLLQGIFAARRWLLGYLLVVLVPAALFLYGFSQQYSQILEDEVTHSMLQTLKQAEINLNSQFDSVRDISNTILMYPRLHEYLYSVTPAEQLDAMKELRRMAENAESNPIVFRMRMFVDETKLISRERVNFFPWDQSVKDMPWYPLIVEGGGRLVWTGAHLEHYVDKGDAYVFSGARMLRDPENYDHQSGVVVIDLAAKTIYDILSRMELTKEQNVRLIAPDGTIILDRNEALLGTKLALPEELEGINRQTEGVFPFQSEDQRKYAVFTTLRSTGWKLVAEVPKSEINARVHALNQYSGAATLTGVSVLFLLLVSMLLAFIVKGLIRRIQTVIRTIKREGIGRLDEGGLAGGDFKLLENTVDLLIHRVHNLMEESYRSKVQEREAQFRALQAQINPHFLYNTLDTINWYAIQRNAPDISQMIEGLADYFRLSLNKGRDVVSVRDELMLAKVYLDIQQSRFPATFTFEIQAEEGVEEEEMPKLTLQPLVENALLHGIRESKDKSGTITIRAWRNGEDIMLSVSDDGVGMEAEYARSLLLEPRTLKPAYSPGGSYGLYNVNERIKLFAGETYGLEIESAPGIGTTVSIRLKNSSGRSERAE